MVYLHCSGRAHTQEPGDAEQIKKFAAGYHADFRMFAKCDVNGANALPLWLYLQVCNICAEELSDCVPARLLVQLAFNAI